MCNLIITIQCLFTLFIYEIPFCRRISLHAGRDANIDSHHIFLFTEYSLIDRPPLPQPPTQGSPGRLPPLCQTTRLSWTSRCNTPGPCNTRLIQPITINFSHSFRYIYKLYTAIIFSVKFETLLNVSIEDIVNSRTHLV